MASHHGMDACDRSGVALERDDGGRPQVARLRRSRPDEDGGDPRVWWTAGILAAREGDADVHKADCWSRPQDL